MLNYKEKLKTLPPVLYINIKSRKDRDDYMKEHLEKYGICNYHRIDAVLGKDIKKIGNKLRANMYATCISHLKALKYFVDNKRKFGKYCIIAEDDINLDTVALWDRPFWDYIAVLRDKKWTAVQLSLLLCKTVEKKKEVYESFNFDIPQLRANRYWSAGCYLIKYDYAVEVLRRHNYITPEKMISSTNYVKLRKMDVEQRVPDGWWIWQKGTTYTMPLVGLNPELPSCITPKNHPSHDRRQQGHRDRQKELIKYVWKVDEDKFAMQDHAEVKVITISPAEARWLIQKFFKKNPEWEQFYMSDREQARAKNFQKIFLEGKYDIWNNKGYKKRNKLPLFFTCDGSFFEGKHRLMALANLPTDFTAQEFVVIQSIDFNEDDFAVFRYNQGHEYCDKLCIGIMNKLKKPFEPYIIEFAR